MTGSTESDGLCRGMPNTLSTPMSLDLGLGRLSGRVALGGCPPRAPTDPDVPALEHPVPQSMGSLLDV